MTIRQSISNVRGKHRLLGSDSPINDRTIAQSLKTKALMVVKQQTDKRKLWSSPNLFTPIECIQMEKRPLTECCDYSSPVLIARSRHRLPRIAEGIYGLLIQRVTGADGLSRINESTPSRYANILQLRLQNKAVYFWILDGYLWITNPDTELAHIYCYPEEDIPYALLHPDEDCGCRPSSVKEPCSNPLDEPFRCPGYLLAQVEDLVSRELLQTYFRIPEDSTQNTQDGQVKNQ